MPSEINIEVPRNGDYFQEWQLADNEGAAIDLTGHTLTASARSMAGTGAVIAYATIDLVEPAEGQFTVLWEGSDFDAVEGETEIVRLAYDLKHIFPDGIIEVPIRGHLVLVPEVTP